MGNDGKSPINGCLELGKSSMNGRCMEMTHFVDVLSIADCYLPQLCYINYYREGQPNRGKM